MQERDGCWGVSGHQGSHGLKSESDSRKLEVSDTATLTPQPCWARPPMMVPTVMSCCMVVKEGSDQENEPDPPEATRERSPPDPALSPPVNPDHGPPEEPLEGPSTILFQLPSEPEPLNLCHRKNPRQTPALHPFPSPDIDPLTSTHQPRQAESSAASR